MARWRQIAALLAWPLGIVVLDVFIHEASEVSFPE
jgi:hypothetical protein